VAPRNPFAPTFGASPPVLAGRDAILADIDEALETGPSHPDFTTLFIGVRGSGKTAMLNAAEDLAREKGWRTISVDATTPGLIERIVQAALLIADESDPGSASIHLAGVKVMGSGFDLDHDPAPPPPRRDLRRLLGDVADGLAENGTGLLITIDELHSTDHAEIREFGAVVQHVTRREGRPVAFAGAALPEVEDTLLKGSEATFLQRCARSQIDMIDPRGVARAIEEPIVERGGRIDAAALAHAVTATSGYAFMVQLVGFYTWKSAQDPTAGITMADVERGIAEAESRIGRLVLGPMWKSLSEMDQRFLLAMAEDDGPTQVADLPDRLGVKPNYLSVYRSRLLRSGMIMSPRRGQLDFAHHATRQWLRDGDDYRAYLNADR
jgi:hypothetical protein